MATLIEVETIEKAKQAIEQAKMGRLQKLAEAWAQQVMEIVLSPVIREMNGNWKTNLDLINDGVAVKSGATVSSNEKDIIVNKGTVVVAHFILQQFKMVTSEKSVFRKTQIQTPTHANVGKIVGFSPVRIQGLAQEDMKIDSSVIAALINEAPLQTFHKGGDELIRRLIEAETRIDRMTLFGATTLEEGADKFREQLVAAKLAGKLEGLVP